MSSFEDNYHTIMDNVAFDDELRARILQNADAARNDAGRAATNAAERAQDAMLRDGRRIASAAHLRQEPATGNGEIRNAGARTRSMSRRRFLGYGIAAAAALAAVGITATGVPARIFDQLAGNDPIGSGSAVAPAPADNGNWFALKAYADEPDAPANETCDLDVGFIVPSSGGAGDANMYEATYLFDFSIAGNNVRSVTYTFDGGMIPTADNRTNGDDGYTWEYVAFREETVTYGGKDAAGNALDGAKQSLVASFTVAYDDQRARTGSSSDDPFRRSIVVRFRQSDETVELNAAANAAARDSTEKNELLAEADIACAYEAALALAAAPLSVTATYEDGANETKRYRIAPTDGFEERYREFRNTRTKTDQTLEEFGNPLFTITELGTE